MRALQPPTWPKVRRLRSISISLPPACLTRRSVLWDINTLGMFPDLFEDKLEGSSIDVPDADKVDESGNDRRFSYA